MCGFDTMVGGPVHRFWRGVIDVRYLVILEVLVYGMAVIVEGLLVERFR